MPAWGIAGALALIGVLFAVPAVVSATAEPATPYVRPSDAFAEPTPTAEAPVALFIGDSYTAGSGASNTSTRWVSIVASELGWVAENRGVGGTGYAAGAGVDRCGSVGCQNFTNVVAELDVQPDQIIVSGGRNDGVTPEEFRGAVEALFVALAQKYPGVPVAVTLPLGDDDVLPSEWKAPIVAEVAAAYGARVLDIGQPLYGLPDAVVADGVHPSDQGHQLIADAFLATWG